MASTAFSRLLSPSLGASGLLLASLLGCSGGDPSGDCAIPCPTGSQCVAGGICVADEANPLRVDVKVHQVSGTVQSDALRCADDKLLPQRLRLRFVSETGLAVLGRFQCDDNGGLGFEAYLPTGRYQASVQVFGAAPQFQTALPTVQGLEVRGNRRDLQLDLRTNQLTGPLLVNGLPVTFEQSCDPKQLNLTFSDNKSGAFATLQGSCQGTPSRYGINLPAGTYRVAGTVKGQPVAAEGFVVSGSSTAQTLNLAGFTIGATVSLNGARLRSAGVCAKVADPTRTYPLKLVLTQAGRGESYEQQVSCRDLDSGVKIALPLGTYEVAAFLDRSVLPAQLPPRLFTAAPLAVRADQDVTLDLRAPAVSGRVVLGAAAASLCAGGNSGVELDAVTLRFFDVARSDDVISNQTTYQQLSVPCDESGVVDFQTSLTPGTYTVGLGPTNNRGDWSPRTDPVVLPAALTVDADRTGVLLQPPLLRVRGRLLIGNSLPTAMGCRSDDQLMVSLGFRERKSGALTMVSLRCKDRDSFSFQTDLVAGTYDVSVGAGAAAPAGVTWPARPIDWIAQGMLPVSAQLGGALSGDGLSISGDLADLRLVLRPRMVQGRLTINGATPAAPPGCADPGRADASIVSLVFSGQPGASISAPISCSAAADFSFSQQVPAGLYQVSLKYESDTAANTRPEGLPTLDEAVPMTDAALPLVNQLSLR